ncbi:TonB-dependent receptor (plasmid) [Bartonella sp. HY329]|uniref:TonB-dependent receptor n=1 Tax=unclassified Bartonella TaxID=2645622 RepID=UPI0021C78529|nr:MULTISPECIES: TonB-dependent receptor [unclassified Bartonella]UXM96460.1 TonB-dependent receptor [Bartonella sp. HY329]UXN10783.1 TonB-dependent receptor [Bartonella sp. HY328]
MLDLLSKKLWLSFGLSSLFLSSTALADDTTILDPIVITATGRAEPASNIAGTIQVINAQEIERSSAQSITDLLAENAVGFFSEWTPGQTSINIRGGASDGQGKDFRSQILVLMNGHRAGSANLSKLSLADVERIEIIRGPSSVVYGSQNIGGIINIILKTGLSAQGTKLNAVTGSWGLRKGNFQTGGVYENIDWFFGISGGARDDYHSGRGGSKMRNTSWKRFGVTGALGYELNEDNRFEVTLRSDGIYDAGFRGSSANIYSQDDRYNRSIDMSYFGQLPNKKISWMLQAYGVRDVDDFNWASPIIRAGNGVPALGTQSDHNRRQLDIMGTRFQPRFALWEGNDLLIGWDFEHSRLRSSRERVGVNGNNLAQVAPQDNNQSETVNAIYIEDSQKLFSDRLTLRAGIRGTYGKTNLDYTPNLTYQIPNSAHYDATTWSAGATFKASERLSLRIGYSTGFRAPTATELAADFTTLGGGRIFGNSALKAESSKQIETGASYYGKNWHIDLAVFKNTISDRIQTRLRSDNSNTSDYVNNSADIVIDGSELQFHLDVLPLIRPHEENWHWSLFSNGAYNFHMVDKGASASSNTRNPQRIYKYQTAIGTRFGEKEARYPWSLQVTGILRGPMWYNTEENLLIPFAEPNRNWIHRKNSFWIVNMRGEVEISKGLSLFSQVNNLFNQNNHPVLIGLDEAPYKLDRRFTNGGRGTSMPGLEFQIGLQAKF